MKRYRHLFNYTRLKAFVNNNAYMAKQLCSLAWLDRFFLTPQRKTEKGVWVREISSCSLVWPDRFFPFFFVVVEKGSGDLIIGFACDKIPRFWQMLISDDEPKRGVKDLWD